MKIVIVQENTGWWLGGYTGLGVVRRLVQISNPRSGRDT